MIKLDQTINLENMKIVGGISSDLFLGFSLFVILKCQSFPLSAWSKIYSRSDFVFV